MTNQKEKCSGEVYPRLVGGVMLQINVVAEFISAWRDGASVRGVKESLPSRLEHSTTGSILFSLGLARQAGSGEK